MLILNPNAYSYPLIIVFNLTQILPGWICKPNSVSCTSRLVRCFASFKVRKLKVIKKIFYELYELFTREHRTQCDVNDSSHLSDHAITGGFKRHFQYFLGEYWTRPCIQVRI